MTGTADRLAPSARRRVFPSWSVVIPTSFEETYDVEGGYWHAFTEDRSVSLTSMVLTDADGSSPRAEMIARQMGPVAGGQVDARPDGLLGWAVTTRAEAPARASRLLQGLLAADGHVLIVTITSDDQDWALSTWLSIRQHPTSPAGAPSGRTWQRVD